MNEGYHPRRSLAMVKLYPSAPVYALTTVYVPAVQERMRFLPALSGLHSLQMEAVALIYMPKNCMYMCHGNACNLFPPVVLLGPSGPWLRYPVMRFNAQDWHRRLCTNDGCRTVTQIASSNVRQVPHAL